MQKLMLYNLKKKKFLFDFVMYINITQSKFMQTKMKKLYDILLLEEKKMSN